MKKIYVKGTLYAVIIGFAVIAFWRGVWGLLDIFLFPNDYVLSLVSSLIIGVIILYLTKHLIRGLI